MHFRGRTVLMMIILTIIASSSVTMLVAGGNGEQAAPPEEQAGDIGGVHNTQYDLDKIYEAFEKIQENYVLEVDEEELIEGAIEGMLNKLGDPYSVYMDEEAARQLHENLSSSFEGIGAEVTIKDGRVTIIAPFKDSPAEKAGLRPLDQIISVNGENIEGMDLYQAVLKIRGPKGTEAKLEIVRSGVSEPFTVTVIRDEIPLETVYTQKITAQGKTFGKIQITSFGQDTAERFKEELDRFEQENIDGLIIDVRGNPGGYLDTVRQIGQLIVPYESIITEIMDRSGEKMVYRSTLDNPKPYPITILVDEGSASASEILAAALQEAGNYKVIGEPTFGKGTVQSTIDLEDDSQIKLTIAKWLTPNENWINETGVQPDVQVSQPEFFRAAYITADPELKRDMNNEQVRNLQIMLEGLGYHPGRKDGYFNLETEQAVRSFQADHDLSVTGVVDEKTAQVIHEQIFELVRDPRYDRQLQKAVEVLLEELGDKK
ncbi:carboxyl-terminal processing protease [Caldalkalibacillus uzonensis]|uniref:Carboxyl-terminal processing protease n=1 Tax=Caldalkalibacillus uzonensis TaxID=353224 RepID=A0ABU0CUB6_9BACI|nr:S41 family peptidase [Caldalkalibacillus uzonensis]MDQ0340001.1 carboxyl-terminal processing protease [Caldalkalibacillus uzonensis]